MKINKCAIVIIGRNEGERLKKCISSVIGTGAIIVYVDSNSADGSLQYAQTQGIVTVDLSDHRSLNASVARNAGFNWLSENSTDVKYIHFIDADCEMAEGWLNKAYDILEGRIDVSVVCGRLREKYPGKSIYTRMCDLSWYIEPGEVNSCGGIATIRKSVYQKLNGFDENLIAGADPEFYYRVRLGGDKIICLDEAMGTHDSAMVQYSQWITRSSKTGFAYANGEKWGRWKKERRSSVFWAGILPISIVASVWILPLASFLLLILYPLQICRIYGKLKIPYDRNSRILYALFCVHDKFPELLGILKYHYARLTGIKQEIIEYKGEAR